MSTIIHLLKLIAAGAGLLLFACDSDDGPSSTSMNGGVTGSTDAEPPGASSSTTGTTAVSTGQESTTEGDASPKACDSILTEDECNGAEQGALECEWRTQWQVSMDPECSVTETEGCVSVVSGGADPGCAAIESCDPHARPSYMLSDDGARFIETCANRDAPDFATSCASHDSDDWCACFCSGG